jgi:hypothetical protein
MKYMLLICEEPGSAAPTGTVSPEYAVIVKELLDSGELAGGERLFGPDSATSVRVRDEKVLTTDGPFAETREFLGGYFVVDVPDLDRALEIAATIPAARTGVVEVRPIQEMAG